MSKQEELEVVEAPVEEEEHVETPEELEAKQKKAAMAAFIVGLVAFLLSGWFGGLVGIICGAIALSKAKKAKGLEAKPGKIFRILGLVFGILGLVGGIIDILMTLFVVFVVGPAAIIGFVVYYLYTATAGFTDWSMFGGAAALALLAL